MTYFTKQRIQWIYEMLAIYGYINREHIEKKFGVSTPQASKDLSEAMKAQPGVMTYNKVSKRYERVPEAAIAYQNHEPVLWPAGVGEGD